MSKVIIWNNNRSYPNMTYFIGLESTPGLTAEIADTFMKVGASRRGKIIAEIDTDSALVNEPIRALAEVFPAHEVAINLVRIRTSRKRPRFIWNKIVPYEKILAFVIRQWTSNIVTAQYGSRRARVTDISRGARVTDVYSSVWLSGIELHNAGEKSAVGFTRLFGYDPRINS
jgi:hypothetical protein